MVCSVCLSIFLYILGCALSESCLQKFCSGLSSVRNLTSFNQTEQIPEKLFITTASHNITLWSIQSVFVSKLAINFYSKLLHLMITYLDSMAQTLVFVSLIYQIWTLPLLSVQMYPHVKVLDCIQWRLRMTGCSQNFVCRNSAMEYRNIYARMVSRIALPSVAPQNDLITWDKYSKGRIVWCH